MSKRIAIIPARGGSKRLPRKNILPVNGTPMISFPIASAKESNLFDMVIVSTDDSEIAEVASKSGADVFWRDSKLASDDSPIVDVCLDVLDRDECVQVSEFCCLYATAIFVTPEDLVCSYELFAQPNTSCVMGVSAFSCNPLLALKPDDSGFLKRMWPTRDRKVLGFDPYRLPTMYVSNGSLYWISKNDLVEHQTFYTPELVGYELDTVDIDTPADYESALAVDERKWGDFCS